MTKRPNAEAHLSSAVVDVLSKAKTEKLSEKELRLVAGIQSLMISSGILEFVYMPRKLDDSGLANGSASEAESEEDSIVWFSVEDSDIDEERGTVLLYGEVTSVLDGPVVIEIIPDA